MGRGVGGEPACDVFFANIKSLARKQDERVEDRAPGDLFPVEREIKVLGSEGISGEQESAVLWIADRQRPVANKPCEAIMSPVIESCRNNGDVRGGRIQRVLQVADEVGAIVQTAIPCQHHAGRRDMRLLFAPRLLGCAEGVIKNAETVAGVDFAAVGAVRREDGTDFFDVFRRYRLTDEIPSSKLDAHDSWFLIPASFLRLIGSLPSQLWLLGFVHGHESPCLKSLKPAFYEKCPHQG